MDIQIINPLEHPNWDNMLLATERYSFFHSSAWTRVLYDTYKYLPLYFSLIENDELKILIPFMEVRSLISGVKAVSLPFTDNCPFLLDDSYNFHELIEYITLYGEEAGWKYIELRGSSLMDAEITPSLTFFQHELDLKMSENDLHRSFRSSTRRNIKKAISKGVKITINNSYEDLDEYYRLHCITRKRHGIPPQPKQFFENIYKYILSKDKGFIVLGTYEKKVISGMIFFYFGNKAIYKYGASVKKFQELRGNNLVMWEGIKHCVQKGFEILDLGRTEKNNQGLRQFKRGWSAEESILNYYKFSLSEKKYLTDDGLSTDSISRYMKLLPVSVLRILGKIIYRHLG